MKRPRKTVFDAVLGEESLRRGQGLAGVAGERLPAFEQSASAEPADPVADVVAEDRGGRRDHDHLPERRSDPS